MFQQKQLNRQIQDMCIEYKDLCDMFLSVLATAENMVKESNKKYGYYDEFNSGKYKTDNGLVLQFLRLLSNFVQNREDFNNEYKDIDKAYDNEFLDGRKLFKFPKTISMKNVQEKIEHWKNLTDNDTYKIYFNEILNIINYKYDLNLENEKKKYYSNIPINDEQRNQRIENIMKVKACKVKDDQIAIDEYANTGTFNYNPVYNFQPGRWNNK